MCVYDYVRFILFVRCDVFSLSSYPWVFFSIDFFVGLEEVREGLTASVHDRCEWKLSEEVEDGGAVGDADGF